MLRIAALQALICFCLVLGTAAAQELATNSPGEVAEQLWNFHAQNTDIIQYHPGIHSPYSGPNSLSSASEVKALKRLFRSTLFSACGCGAVRSFTWTV